VSTAVATAEQVPTSPAGRGHDAIGQAGELRSARIESLRALAALGVLFGHVYASIHLTADERYGTYVERIALGGGAGVYLFFALSGYLLYRPFARRDVGGGAAIDLRRYAVNRAVRILPLYYAVVAVMLLVTQHGGTRKQWLVFGTFSENFFDHSFLEKVDGVVWSLVVEVQFYVLLPLIALGIAWVARGSAWRACAAIAGAGLASEVVRYVMVQRGLDPSQQWRHAFLTCFVYFVPGMLLAVITARGRSMPRPLAGRVAGSSTAWLIGAAAVWMLAFYDYGLDIALLGATFLTLAACVLPLRAGALTRALEWRWLAGIGVASYSLYLWHQPIVQRLPLQSWYPHNVPGAAAIAVPLCVAIAVGSYLVVERPFLRLRRRWSSDSAPIVTAAPPATEAAAG